jgi:hypothetical protein
VDGYSIDVLAPRRVGSVSARWVECLLRAQPLTDFATAEKLKTSMDSLDLHHIFPQKWMVSSLGLEQVESVGQSFVNLTFIQGPTNRGVIQGLAPSQYVAKLHGGAARDKLADALMAHGIPLELLEQDDFEGLVEFRARWFDEVAAKLSAQIG